MKFINRHVIVFATIVLVATLLLYMLLLRQESINSIIIGVSTIAYMFIIALSAVLISRKDEHQGFFGFNYNLAAYVVCIAVPLCLHAAGVLPDDSFVAGMALFWGAGIVIHFVIFMVVLRKRRLKSYDKSEIFK